MFLKTCIALLFLIRIRKVPANLPENKNNNNKHNVRTTGNMEIVQ